MVLYKNKIENLTYRYYKSILSILPILLIMLLLLVHISTVMAEEDSSNLESYTLDAANIDYDYQAGKIFASNNVVFTSEELTVKADELVIDMKEKLVKAQGENVFLSTSDKNIKGDYLEYNYDQKTGNFYGAESKIGDLNFKGKIIKLVKGKDYDMEVEEGIFTPCIFPDNPHYHIKATSVKVYPGNRVVGKDVQYWWGNIKLFTLPGYVMKYDENGKLTSVTPTPHLGYNSEDGLTMELTYPYEINENSKGEIYINTMKQGNIGGDRDYRIDNRYQITPKTVLNTKFEHKKVIDDDDELTKTKLFSSVLNYKVNSNLTWQNKIKYLKELDDGSIDLDKILSTGLVYNKNRLNFASDIGYNFADEKRNESISIGYGLAKNYHLSLYHDYVNEIIDHRYYTLSSNALPVKWRLYYKDGYDIDYSPYLKLTFPGFYNINSSLGVGREIDGNIAADKARLSLQYNNGFNITNNLKLGLNEKVVTNFYTWPVKEKYQSMTTKISANYGTDVTEKVKLGAGLSWEKTTTKGNYFIPDDEVDEEELLKPSLDLTVFTAQPQSAWVIQNNNEYNISTEEWEKVALGIKRQFDCYDFAIEYDFIDKVFGFNINF